MTLNNTCTFTTIIFICDCQVTAPKSLWIVESLCTNENRLDVELHVGIVFACVQHFKLISLRLKYPQKFIKMKELY